MYVYEWPSLQYLEKVHMLIYKDLKKVKHYHLQVQANPKKIAQKNRCYF